LSLFLLSPSSRRAWIEIETWWGDEVTPRVALLAEGVDRNSTSGIFVSRVIVALLAEGVDRNIILVSCGMEAKVALLAEGVDRNLT